MMVSGSRYSILTTLGEKLKPSLLTETVTFPNETVGGATATINMDETNVPGISFLEPIRTLRSSCATKLEPTIEMIECPRPEILLGMIASMTGSNPYINELRAYTKPMSDAITRTSTVDAIRHDGDKQTKTGGRSDACERT
jgi:hypothetical protein